MLKNLRLMLMITFLFAFAGIGFSQETKGSIDGTVTDASGAVIPNATVTVQGNAFNRTTQADGSGFFRVLAVPPGQYSLTAAADGFRTSKETKLGVTVGSATLVTFKLQVSGSTVTVDVTDDIGVIDTTSSGVSESITAERAEQLPKGVSFSTLLASTPSVRAEPKGAGFSINGASGAENTFIIDGQEVTNFRTGQLQTNNDLPFALIQEIQVKSGGFAAELGGATGGVVSIVTKSGGNEFAGEIGTDFRVANLEPGFRQALFGNSDNLTYVQSPKDDYTFFYPSVSFSGPIVKDRLWFFTSYNVQSEIINRTTDYAAAPTEETQLNTRRDYGLIKLDSQVTNQLNLSASYTYNPVRQHGALDSTTPFATSPPSDGSGLVGRAFTDTQGGRRASSIWNIGGTYTPTNNLIIGARYGESYLNEKLGAYGIPNVVRYRCLASTHQGVTYCPQGDQNVPTNFANNKDISTRKTFDIDASFIASNFGGRHIFKVGYNQNKLNNDVDQGYVGTGEIRYFYGRSSFGFGVADGGIGYVYLQRFGAFGNTGSKSQALYVQDSWTIGRLTLNPGVRIEKENVPSFSETGIPILFGWGDKIAPRFGFAYDVKGDGKWKVSGGYGWFYDRFKYELPRGLFGGNTFLRNYKTIQAGQTYLGPGFQRDTLISGGTQFDFRVPSNDPSDNRIDPDLLAARESQFDLGTEFEIAQNYVLGVRYIHKNVDRAIEDVGIFDAAGNENFFIANPGFGIVSEPFFPGFEPTPKAERKYDAVEFKFIKRFSNNYFFNGSYTYSRLFGNYSGLASSDENGRSSPNVNRFFDLPFLGFDTDGNPDNGRLATDRPHVFKLNAGYSFDWMGSSSNTTNFNMFFIGQSGTPISTRISFYGADTFLNGRGDLGRTPVYTETDFAVSHRYKFGSDNRYALAFNLDILNLFDQDVEINRFESVHGTSIAAPDLTLFHPGVTDELTAIGQVFNGGIGNALRELISRGDQGLSTCGAAGTATCSAFKTDARFNQTSAYQGPRSVRFGFKFIF